LEGHSEEVIAVAFSPVDKNRLVSTSFDLTVRLWDVEEERLHATAHGASWSLTFTPDGRRVAAKANGAIFPIDADTGNEVGSLDAYGAAFAFSPDGKTIAVEDADMQRVRLVTCATADEVTKDLAERRDRAKAFDLARKAPELHLQRSVADSPGIPFVIESLFDEFDTNSDNVLDKQELSLATMRARFLSESAELKRDEAVDRNEGKSYYLQIMFNRLDGNNGGKIKRAR